MYSSKVLAGATVAAFLVAAPLAAQADAVLTNAGTAAGTIGPLGNTGLPDELGEVFTAPVSGTLSSLTLTFNGVPQTFEVGIGEWNGPSAWAPGYGVTAIDYESGPQTAIPSGDFTFNPDVAVTAGLQYVAFVTTFGLTNPADGANGLVYSQTPTNGLDYIVYSFGDPNSTPWAYNYNYQADLQVTANFTTPNPCNVDHPQACVGAGGVPEPAAWALMILGFGGIGVTMRRRRALKDLLAA